MASVGFLVVSLVAVVVTLSDPAKRQLIATFAGTEVIPVEYRPTAPNIIYPPPNLPAQQGYGDTPVQPCFSGCSIEDITLPGQEPGRPGYVYSNGNIAGFYEYPAGSGKYYPVNQNSGGPTVNDLNKLAQSINAQRSATTNAEAYKDLLSLNPTVAKETTKILTSQCQSELPAGIDCTTTSGLMSYIDYEKRTVQILLSHISSKPGTYTDLQINTDLARLKIYASRGIITLDQYNKAFADAKNYINQSNDLSSQVTGSVGTNGTPFAGVTGSAGGRTPTPTPASPFSGITGTVGVRTPTPTPTSPLSGITGTFGARTPTPTPRSINPITSFVEYVSSLLQNTGSRSPAVPEKTTSPFGDLTGSAGAKTPTPTPTSRFGGVTGTVGVRTPTPTPTSPFRGVTGTTGARTPTPTPASLFGKLSGVAGGRTPTPTPTTFDSVTGKSGGIADDKATPDSTLTVLVKTAIEQVRKVTGIIPQSTNQSGTIANIQTTDTQKIVTQTTYQQTDSGVVRKVTVTTTDLATGKVVDTRTSSTQISQTDSETPKATILRVQNAINNIVSGITYIVAGSVPKTIIDIITPSAGPKGSPSGSSAPGTSNFWQNLTSIIFNRNKPIGITGTSGITNTGSFFGNILERGGITRNTANVTNLTNNSATYNLGLQNTSGVNINSLPANYAFTNDFTLNFNSQNKTVTLSFPYGNGRVTVSDIKTIEAILANMGGLSRFLPSLEFVKADNLSGDYISAVKSTQGDQISARLVVDLNTNGQFDLARAISSTLKYGPYGSGQNSELLVAYHETFYLGKAGTPGNYVGIGPIGNSVANSGNTIKDAQDDLAYSLAQYLTDPELLKKRDPQRYAFINAVYLGYNPLDIQLVNKDGPVSQNNLNTNQIIKNYDNQLNQQNQYLANNGWSDIPQAVASNNAKYQSAVENAANTYGVPVGIITGVMENESGAFSNRDSIVSDDGYGSIGVMQVIPREGDCNRQNLKQADKNIECGTRILKQIYEDPSLGNGNWRDTLALYNTGDWNTLLNKPIISTGGYEYADSVLIDAGLNPADVVVNP